MTETRRFNGVALGSIAVSFAVVALKGFAWWHTGGAALFSDALESLIHPATAFLTYGALWFAARPADANHPFGHGKAEFFAAVILGALIVAAALAILQHAWLVWRVGPALSDPLAGIMINAVATALNAIWGVVLQQAGRRLRSPALRADGIHLLTDVLTSAGLLGGLGLALATGDLWLDPLLAAAIAIYVLITGFFLIRASIDGLMDAAPSPAVVERIRRLVAEHASGALEVHDLRTRNAGQTTFLQFHLVVPGGMTVDEAHAICDRIEAALREEMAGLVATIHVEPESKAKHHGVVVL
uniref:Protein p34 n=1 Tax=Acidicaldus sp. TaxID=1872105 RepID=A0A8J4HA79_9PROT